MPGARALELELAARRAHPLVDRGEPDVALGERLGAAARPASHGRRRRPRARACRRGCGSRPRPRSRREWRAALVSSSRATASSSSSSRSSASGVDVERDLEPALARRLPGDGAERLLEAALLEGHRVQRQHRLAQPRDRRLDDLVRALHLGAPGRGLDQLLVGGEQGLQRVVVDQLRDPPPALVLGLPSPG